MQRAVGVNAGIGVDRDPVAAVAVRGNGNALDLRLVECAIVGKSGGCECEDEYKGIAHKFVAVGAGV